MPTYYQYIRFVWLCQGNLSICRRLTGVTVGGTLKTRSIPEWLVRCVPLTRSRGTTARVLTESRTEKVRLSKKQLWVLFLCNLVNWIGANGLIPLLPVYATQRGADPAATGYYLASVYLGLAAGSFASG